MFPRLEMQDFNIDADATALTSCRMCFHTITSNYYNKQGQTRKLEKSLHNVKIPPFSLVDVYTICILMLFLIYRTILLRVYS